jgi:hypothetical protein
MGMRTAGEARGGSGSDGTVLGIVYISVLRTGSPCTVDNFIFGVCSARSNSPPDSMNRLKRLAAVLLNPTEDPEQTHSALEAAGVPVSFADCRNCPNPCEDGK